MALGFWRVGRLRVGVERSQINPERHPLVLANLDTGRRFATLLTTGELRGLREVVDRHLGRKPFEPLADLAVAT